MSATMITMGWSPTLSPMIRGVRNHPSIACGIANAAATPSRCASKPNLRIDSTTESTMPITVPRYGTTNSSPALIPTEVREVDADDPEPDAVEHREHDRDGDLALHEPAEARVDLASDAAHRFAVPRRHERIDRRDDAIPVLQQKNVKIGQQRQVEDLEHEPEARS
jgi:hypothetical protein